jgi:paired amphipathic helix protein Sin3a
MQLLGKDDHIQDDLISSEEKWSLYVDQFVQLSATEGVNMKRNEPFLKRNLPIEVSEDPPQDVETVSGLELKICVNTYKIFFVDNTEDYFRRKPTGKMNEISKLSKSEREEREAKVNLKRHVKFRAFLDSERGWKQDEQGQEVFDEWASSNRVQTIKRIGESYRIFE